jgi:hypothetical protein
VTAPNTLVQIVDLLRWENETFDIRGLCEKFESHIDGNFDSPEFSDVAGASLVAALRALPCAARRDFLRAPQVVSQLLRWRNGLQPDVRYLSELILAELARADLITSLPVKLWTARGDMHLSFESGRCIKQVRPRILGTEISFDDKSYQMFPYDGTKQKLLLPVEDDQSDQVRSALSEALRALSTGDALASHFVRSFLQQISIRIEPGEPAKFNSSSFSQYIGLVLLINAHLDSVDVPNLTEALVHESIHNMLFMIEELESPFLPDRSSSKIQVRSPWSGSIINLHAYVHACVVWYGLFFLWNRLLEKKIFPEHRCIAFRERARTGFIHRPLELISSYTLCLSREILEVLEEIEGRMQADNPPH